jgi:hypothetical protein
MSVFAEQQPGIFNFVNNSEFFNGDELFILFCTTEMAWHIINRILNRNPQVSPEFVYEQHCRNVEQFDKSDYRQNGVISGVIKNIYLPTYQYLLLHYLVNLLRQGLDEPGSTIRGEKFPVMILYVKTVVDCLLLDEETEMAEVKDESFSEAGLMSVQETVIGYINEFMETPEFMKLGDQDKEYAADIIHAFSGCMYKLFLIQPKHWNARRSASIVSDVLPKLFNEDDDDDEDEDDFIVFEPVLMSFMEFCADRGYVPDGNIISSRLCMLI